MSCQPPSFSHQEKPTGADSSAFYMIGLPRQKGGALHHRER